MDSIPTFLQQGTLTIHNKIIHLIVNINTGAVFSQIDDDDDDLLGAYLINILLSAHTGLHIIM